MKKGFLLMGLMLLHTYGYAGDLMDAYHDALRSDPKLKQALAQRDAAQENTPIALSVLLPQVNVVAESETVNPALVNNTGFAIDISDITVKDHGYTITATQSIFDPSSWYSLGQAQHIADAADSTYVSAEQELILRVAQSYFDVLRTEDDLSFTKAEKDAFEQQLKQTEEKFNVGLVAITDLHDFRAKFDESVANEITAQNNLDDAKERLQEITYRYYDVLKPLRPELPLSEPSPENMEEWVKFAQANNPDLIAAKFTMDSQRSAVDSTKAQHLPVFNVETAYASDTSGLVTNPGDNVDAGWSIRFQGTMNLVAGGGIQAAVRQAQYNYEDAFYGYENTLRQTVTNTKLAYRGVITSIGQVSAFRQAVISAQSSKEANVAAYEVGTKTSVDVLDSISQLYNQQRNLARTRYDYIINMLRLKRAAGTLNMKDLEQANSWLAFMPQNQSIPTDADSINTDIDQSLDAAPSTTPQPTSKATQKPKSKTAAKTKPKTTPKVASKTKPKSASKTASKAAT